MLTLGSDRQRRRLPAASSGRRLLNKLTEQQLKHLCGWGQSSRMAATYVHLSGREVDDALLAVYGKKRAVEENRESGLKPTDCPRCKETNEYSNVFCKKCGWALDKEAAVPKGAWVGAKP